MAYLKQKFPNIIYEESFDECANVSQYLIAGVDAVITFSSGLAWQTLIWDKKLITLGEKYLDFMADAKSVDSLKQLLAGEARCKNDILYWCLKKYVILDAYFCNASWLYNHLKVLLKNKESNSITEFYPDIDTDENLFNILEQSIDFKYTPQKNTVYSYDKLSDLYVESQQQIRKLELLYVKIAELSQELSIIKGTKGWQILQYIYKIIHSVKELTSIKRKK